MKISGLFWLIMGLGAASGISPISFAVSNISPLSSSASAVPVPITVSANSALTSASSLNSGDSQALSDQVSQLHGTLETLIQQETQQQNELSLLQQRVLQLEAQNELARSKLPAEVSSPSSSLPIVASPQASSPSAGADLYAKAYEYINQGEYKKAETALNGYLAENPKGQNAPDAHYWLGEINMVNAESDVAAKEFRIVIETFPNSPRAPGAMRELGEIFLANGDSQHAKQTLKMVIQKYPDTAAAVLAQKTLDTM